MQSLISLSTHLLYYFIHLLLYYFKHLFHCHYLSHCFLIFKTQIFIQKAELQKGGKMKRENLPAAGSLPRSAESVGAGSARAELMKS